MKWNEEDIWDSRDAQERIEELEDQEELDEFDQEELDLLLGIREETRGMDWEDGIVFIHDSYFEDYAQELAEDIGAIQHSYQWPTYCIDWERAARELQQDYTSIEIDGITFWYREA